MAGAKEDFSEPLEDIVTKALPRISAIIRRNVKILICRGSEKTTV